MLRASARTMTSYGPTTGCAYCTPRSPFALFGIGGARLL